MFDEIMPGKIKFVDVTPMKKLIITTTRIMSWEDWAEYKKVSQMQVDWKELEEKGSIEFKDHVWGENVKSELKLEEVSS